MKIVMDIPEDFYNYLKSKGSPKGTLEYLIIDTGVLLPKGHGRLIDANKLSQDDEVTEWVSRDAVRTGKQLKMFSELFLKKIKDAPTVIEADKEDKND